MISGLPPPASLRAAKSASETRNRVAVDMEEAIWGSRTNPAICSDRTPEVVLMPRTSPAWRPNLCW